MLLFLDRHFKIFAAVLGVIPNILFMTLQK